MLDGCPSEQIRNLWVLAINTGMRHGEISALAWEDVDLKEGTITISRNIAIKGHFTPPKTESGNRVVNLTEPAIQALKNQLAYTRMGKQHGSFGATWNDILKRAGIRHRRAYESRHTYACWALSAGANPNFIATQMGHTSAQMVYNVYGKWMSDNNVDQLSILNANFNSDAPQMPQAISM